LGFRSRGRSYNRSTKEGLTHVISIALSPFDPPATTYHPGLRENRYGTFSAEVGVYIPEVARILHGSEAKSWVSGSLCCIRIDLGVLATGEQILWQARADDAVKSDFWSILEGVGMKFFDTFERRERILNEWRGRSANYGFGSPPRIICAIIYNQLGNAEEARRLLAQQALEARNRRHSEYVRSLAERLGLDALDGA